MRRVLLGGAVMVLSLARGRQAQAAPTAAEEAAYTKSITERADKVIATLGLDDAAKATRIRTLVVQQYRELRDIQAARDAKTAEVNSSADPALGAAWKSLAQKEADLKTFPLHRRFVARLVA